MTLNQILDTISKIGINDKLVNYAGYGSSVYELNSLTIRDYPILFVSQTGDIIVYENYTEFNLTIFYIDRLLSDKSNDVEIHSSAVEVLKNIFNKIKINDNIIDAELGKIQLFTEPEKFSDKCNGAFAQLKVLAINNSVCAID
ncbi:MAG: hypothetical protein MJ231_06020 [bacterium]|nr:hypothetical protein [bacterium]